jgi:glycosyltransferase involved in cell wall biosynthesis
LRESIDSILADSPSEVVVVNDGSTDGRTLDVLGHLERKGVRVINQANAGTIAALATGFDAATSPYVLCFAADDVLEPGSIGALTQALDANPKAAAAWGDAQTFGLSNFRIPSAPSIDPWLLTYLNPITGMALLRREAIDDIGGWRARDGVEDWDLWLSLAERGWAGVRIPMVTFLYRRDRGGRNVENERTLEFHYELLRQRHQKLFADRSTLRKRSDAPVAVKALLPVIDQVPVSRLLRLHGSQLVVYLFWTAGVRQSLRMLRHALTIRLRH